VKVDSKIKKNCEEYEKRHRIFEFIDCAIYSNFRGKYKYFDNEMPLYTNPDRKTKKKTFATDLVYISNDYKRVLFIEETRNPCNKKDQLKAYALLSSHSLRSITKTDITPEFDVFLVFPEEYRDDALNLYDEIKSEFCELGKRKGISLWFYPPSKRYIKCAGGTFSQNFPAHKDKLSSQKIGTFRILKSAPPAFLLKYVVIKALQSKYGETKNGIEMNKEKLSELLQEDGILDEGKWRAMIKLGRDVGWFENVSLEQFIFTIKYTKISPQSINRSKQLAADFWHAIEEEGDEIQSSLIDFYQNGTEERTDEIDDDIDYD